MGVGKLLRVMGLIVVLAVAVLLAVVLLTGRLGGKQGSVPQPAGVSSPPAQDVVIQISEAYLSYAVAREVAKLKVQHITSVLVDLKPNQAVDTQIEGRLELGPIGMTLAATLKSKLDVQTGRLVVAFQSVEAGGINLSRAVLPGPVRGALDDLNDALNLTLEATVKRQGLAVQTVATSENAITVELMRE